MRALAFLSIPLLLVLACGGSSSSAIADPPATDGGTDGSSTTSSSSSGSTGGAYTLDDVCDRTAPKICALRKSCCEKSHGYDEAACIANSKADCAKDVADVRGGRMTFHPELIDPCIAKFQPILDACFETIDLLFQAASIAECRIFQGQLDEGARCERDSQCKSGPAGSFVDCNSEREACTYTRFFKEGEACRYGDSAGGFCEKGLYCDAPLGSSVPGTCKKATPVGSSCDTLKLISTECGLGAYCDRGTGKCTAAKDDGATCDTAFECKSLRCESGGSGSGRKCQKPQPIVTESECK
jgi:hypothetical protein